MKTAVTRDTIEAIKADLRHALPGVKSSHRAEAIARGLGWRTNAALIADLAGGPAERTLDPEAFAAFLAERSHAVDGRVLVRAALRGPIRAAMAAHEQLTHSGFGIPGGHRLPFDEWQRRFDEEREGMLVSRAVDEFERAREYLSHLEATKTVNRRHDSLYLKHAAERFHERRGIRGKWDRVYVSNGMLLAAAQHLGFQVRRAASDGFVGYLNVSGRSVRDVEDEAKPPLPQPEAGQPFRVLGHNQGRRFFLPAGRAKVVSLGPGAFTPANLLRLAPLDHWVGLFPPRDRRAPFDTEAAMDFLMHEASEAGFFEADKYRPPRAG